jgi:hypothetical protein
MISLDPRKNIAFSRRRTIFNKMTMPSEADQERAKWALLQAQIDLAHAQVEQIGRQARLDRWEVPKAIAMIALALAAIVVASRVADLVLPVRPQTIIVHLEK